MIYYKVKWKHICCINQEMHIPTQISQQQGGLLDPVAILKNVDRGERKSGERNIAYNYENTPCSGVLHEEIGGNANWK